MWAASLLSSGAMAFGRLLVVSLMPSAVTVFAAWVAARGAISAEFRRTHELVDLVAVGGKADTLALLLVLLAVALLAALLQTFQVQFVRLLEGYWGRAAGTAALRAAGVRRQQRRFTALWDRFSDGHAVLRSPVPAVGALSLQAVRRERRRRLRAPVEGRRALVVPLGVGRRPGRRPRPKPGAAGSRTV